MNTLSPLSAKATEASIEESLELRKIAEYWKEKDYKTVKTQIRDFLRKKPKSSFADQLNAMLGDLYFQEKNFQEAAIAYNSIQSKEFRQKTQFHFLHSLYATKKYDEFVSISDNFLKNPNSNAEEINTIHFELGEIYFSQAHLPENEKNKKDLMKAALFEYNQVMQTKYGEMSLLPQAQILAFLEEHQKAASIFVLLAHKEQPSKKEEYLFQAASLQLHFDKEKAIQTFGSIYELGEKNASKAAFNQLNLLFQEKRHQDFILAFDKAQKYVSPEKLPLMQYFLGKSLYIIKNYPQAIEPLSQCLASKSLESSQKKSALFTLIACAKETQDLTLFEKALATLKAEFAHEEETANVLLMHAQLCREKKQWSKARMDINEVLELNPQHPQKEALLYDNALLMLEDEKWQEGASAFEAFIKDFPKSGHRQNALRHLINCRLEDSRLASVETQRLKKEQLLATLQIAMKEKKSFSSSEKQKMRYLLGKTQFELGSYEEAIENLSEYVIDYSKDPTCADAYLLLAYAHQRGEHDDIHFALNAEKALSANPHLHGANDLHLTLFNIYLGMASKAGNDEKAEVIEKAAEHLFLALGKPPSQENQRWLAAYYFQQYKNGKNEAAERAVTVLEKLLEIRDNQPAISITEQTLEKEAETLKLAELYRKINRSNQYFQLLEAMANEYKAHPNYPWKYQRMAQFELGKAYLAAGEKQKALKAFEELASSAHISSYFALAATVEKAKLDFSMLKAADRHEDSSPATAICDTLKEVQLKRKLHSEPLHLEAALCYVECKSELAQESEQKKRAILLLENMKENFSDQNDPLVQQYFSASLQFPEKKRLFEQYLAFVDLEIQRLNAEEAHDSLLLHEIKEKLDHLLSQVNEEALSQRISKSREAVIKAL